MFKIGDRVRVIEDYSDAMKGDEGIIRALPGKNGGRGLWDVCYSVEFPAWQEDEFRGHSCGGTVPSGYGHWVAPGNLELIKAASVEKIVITHDGKTTLARLYEDNKVVKSAKYDPRGKFDFALGAKIAFARLMTEKREEPPKFDKSMLANGRFGCTSDGDWFVVVGDKLVFNSGNYDYLGAMNSEGEYSTYRVKFVCEALSFDNAKTDPQVIWKSPDFELKEAKDNV